MARGRLKMEEVKVNDSLIGSQWRRRRWKNWLSRGRKWSNRYMKQNEEEEDKEAAEALNWQMPIDERVGGKKRRRGRTRGPIRR